MLFTGLFEVKTEADCDDVTEHLHGEWPTIDIFGLGFSTFIFFHVCRFNFFIPLFLQIF